MLVSSEQIVGTIGGGQLECRAIEVARKLLQPQATSKTELLQLPLGPELLQCCGGYAELMLERLTASDHSWLDDLKTALSAPEDHVFLTDWQGSEVSHETARLSDLEDTSWSFYRPEEFAAQNVAFAELEKYSGHFQMAEPIQAAAFNLYVFGAGHVGRAIVQTLAPLPIKISWIDPRAEEFPATTLRNVEKIVTEDPLEEVHKAASSGYFLVMTHSHQLDFDLTAEILQRRDAAYLGLIGSKTKRNRFFKRFEAAGFTKFDLERITCPIGIAGTGGKHPSEIAISVAAEILQLRQRHLESLTRQANDSLSRLSVVNR